MPAWARGNDAQDPAPFCFLDLLLLVCRHVPGYTVDQLLDEPVGRFWRMVGHVHRHREELAEAARENPLAALALLLGR